MPSRLPGSLIGTKNLTRPKESLCKDCLSEYTVRQRVGSTSFLNKVFLNKTQMGLEAKVYWDDR